MCSSFAPIVVALVVAAVFEEAETERAGSDKGTLNIIPSGNAHVDTHFRDANCCD